MARAVKSTHAVGRSDAGRMMRVLGLIADRTAVFFLGVGAGCMIGYAFVGDGMRAFEARVADAAGIGADRVATVAPPPPTAGTTPVERAASAGQGVALPALGACDECIRPASARLAERVARGDTVRIGVFGDSFGDGVHFGLYQQLKGKDGFEVVGFSQQSTGFTRYRSLDLEAKVRQQVAEQPVDIAVVSFGANDVQGVLTRPGHAAALMSPEWQRVIGERIERYIGILRDQGAMIYWVGLPRMREARFDADIAAMNGFYARLMAKLGVPFVDTVPASVDGAGHYAPYLIDGPKAKRTLIRANDGVHMSMPGYVRITRALAARIKTYRDSARTPPGEIVAEVAP